MNSSHGPLSPDLSQEESTLPIPQRRRNWLFCAWGVRRPPLRSSTAMLSYSVATAWPYFLCTPSSRDCRLYHQWRVWVQRGQILPCCVPGQCLGTRMVACDGTLPGKLVSRMSLGCLPPTCCVCGLVAGRGSSLRVGAISWDSALPTLGTLWAKVCPLACRT